jgi:urea transporter
MHKLLRVSLLVIPFVLSGCYFTVNATMCDQIRTDPNAVVPQECRNYDEKAADKASQINHEINGSEIIKFSPKQN